MARKPDTTAILNLVLVGIGVVIALLALVVTSVALGVMLAR